MRVVRDDRWFTMQCYKAAISATQRGYRDPFYAGLTPVYKNKDVGHLSVVAGSAWRGTDLTREQVAVTMGDISTPRGDEHE